MPFCERLNSEGKQFHQFQENENPPVTSNYWTQKRPRHIYMTLEIQCLAWNRHKNVVELNRLWNPNPDY